MKKGLSPRLPRRVSAVRPDRRSGWLAPPLSGSVRQLSRDYPGLLGILGDFGVNGLNVVGADIVFKLLGDILGGIDECLVLFRR